MKNLDISFQSGQIVLYKNIISEVTEVRSETLLLELSGNRGTLEVPKKKVHLITFGAEIF
jgi:hypothetical protein